jgi:hypothetical protein
MLPLFVLQENCILQETGYPFDSGSDLKKLTRRTLKGGMNTHPTKLTGRDVMATT